MSATKPTGSSKGAKTASARKKAEDMAETLKQEGEHLLDETKRHAEGMAKRGNGMLADYLSALAAAGDTGAQEMERSGYKMTADLLARAAQDCEDYAGRVSEQEPQEVLSEATDFARAHPGLVMGAAFTVGLCASRFFLSAADREGDDAPADGPSS